MQGWGGKIRLRGDVHVQKEGLAASSSASMRRHTSSRETSPACSTLSLNMPR